MCGIAGELQWKNTSLSLIENVSRRQRHRGPDSDGLYRIGDMALAHRRLKIFDLTDRAAQPLVDHTLGLALVFNGAIYNFHELRKELEQKNYQFISESDTEVLLKAYHAWGEGCLERLQGMFAFAVWERDSGKLLLARDRLGIKPLYYAHTANGFHFASTLQALLEFEGIDTSIDKEALHHYLMFHAVPEPLTILSGIRKLPPGTSMVVHESGKVEQKNYWRFDFNATGKTYTQEQWLDQTETALTAATQRQLCADVPLGILLSGGLDSSLIVALAAKAGHSRLETFSIGFESAHGEDGNEFYYSDIIARHFNTSHHKLSISNLELTDALGDCVREMSEPMVSHDNIGFYMLSREVAKHVKVVLSGQGADEMFAGYHWFQKIGYREAGSEEAAQLLTEMITDRSYEEYTQTVTPAFRVDYQAQHFIHGLCKGNKSPMLLDHVLKYESTMALANGPLCRVDNMTMASSLEARVPFLDEIVVDLATRMPLSMKLPDDGKYVLKQLGRKILPSEIVNRPKGYFPVPALKYLHGPTLELMHEVLSTKHIKERGIYNADTVKTLLAAPDQHLTSTGVSKLWQLGLLEFWLQQQGL